MKRIWIGWENSISVAGELADRLLDLLLEFVLGQARVWPLLLGLQDDEGVREFGGIGSEATSAVPVFEKTKATCGNLATASSTSSCIVCDCDKRGAGDAQRVHRDVLLVERRDELLAEPCEQKAGPDQEEHRRHDEGQRSLERAPQDRPVSRLERPYDEVLLLLHSSGDDDGDHRRHEGQRQDEGRGKRDDHRQRHRLEHLALDAGEGEERHVDEDDDRLSVNGRLDHLLGRPHRLQALLGVEDAPELVLPLGQMPQAVLGDDDRPVDDQAEVERAKAHQVAADPRLTIPVIVISMRPG